MELCGTGRNLAKTQPDPPTVEPSRVAVDEK